MARAGINLYHVLLLGAKKPPSDDADKIKEKEMDALKVLNFTVYTELILAQEDTF